MKTKKAKTLMALAMALVLLLLISASALAMASPNFMLNWFTSLNGSGGGPSVSTSYAANITVGQTATGDSSSTNYKLELGYWAGIDKPSHIYLPILKK
jgi:hypothetical protein